MHKGGYIAICGVEVVETVEICTFSHMCRAENSRFIPDFTPKLYECHMSRDIEPMPHCESSGPEGHAGIATCLRSSRTIFSAISAANDGLLRTVEAKRTQPDLLALRPTCSAVSGRSRHGVAQTGPATTRAQQTQRMYVETQGL
jgi:hypothetical protein